ALAESADEILAKTDKAINNYNDMSMTSIMHIKESSGAEKTREMKIWLKGEQRLVKFTKPATDAGISLLSTDSSTNYVYLPAYKKVRRVASHVRNQTFMGTDFSQEDMAILRYGDDFTPTLKSEDENTYTLEVTRKPDAKISYSKLQLIVNKKSYVVERIDYFDNGGDKVKTEVRSDFKEIPGNEGVYPVPTTITMTDAKTGHETVLKQEDLTINKGLDDEFFSQRNLKRPVR
ncbi:MAG: outer membrane lipoprotein-sorting protein, partial [Deltaproteobacteria bacterium]|nr:outer membrane lipoprotein-sorting protein [Deltaproteobacteria bacterium]